MIIQQDTIPILQAKQPAAEAVTDLTGLASASDENGRDSVAAARVSSRPRTAYEVLKRLPPDATPAQQDSAIQAWLQVPEIHYNDRTDTLQMPGADSVEARQGNTLPIFYRENFFSKDTLFQSETAVDRFGVAGDPVPYSLRSDNVMTLLLLACFVLFAVSLANSRRFIARQLREIFYVPKAEDTIFETAGEVRFQSFLVLLACLLMGISAFLYTTEYVTDTFMLDDDLMLVGIFFLVFLAYYAIKGVLYIAVNTLFFGARKAQQFEKLFLFMVASTGVLIFPIVLVLIYFDLLLETAAYYFVFVVIISKLLTFYKLWAIFFRQNGFVLQIILYFCALEIVPLLILGGVLPLVVDSLKVIF